MAKRVVDKKKLPGKILMWTTFGIGFFITFLDTPYVFGGVLMNEPWQTIGLVALFVFFFELPLINAKEMPLLERVWLFVFPMILLISRYWVATRTGLNLLFLWMILSFVITVYVQYQGKKDVDLRYNRLFILSLLVGISLLAQTTDLDLFDERSLVLWSLLPTAIISSVLMVLLWKGKIDTKDESRWIYIILFIMGPFFLCFLCTSFFNYTLDGSEPITYTTEIIELDVHTGSRSVTTYNVTFLYEGEEHTVGVSSTMYFTLQVGDDFSISVYQGFFGFEYMIAE